MKKLILLLTVFFSSLGVKAQEATTDYIYNSDGFEIKTGVFVETYEGGSTYTYNCKGLYTKDGKTLVRAIGTNGDGYTTRSFYVLSGCETICSGAFHSMAAIIYIPSSVRYIAPDAFNSHSGFTHTNTIGGIEDDCKEQSGSVAVNAPAADPNATEVARYNVQGVRLSEPTDGVNIVQMSDGTAQKVLVR